MSSIRGINGVSSGSTPLDSKEQFSASLEKAQKSTSSVITGNQKDGTVSEKTALAGRVVHGLVNGEYGEHDISSGNFAQDVEKIIGEKIDTNGLPEGAGRTKVANAFIKFLKSSEG